MITETPEGLGAGNRAMRKLTGNIVQDMATAWCRALGKSRMPK